jgi:diaminopropionate ammonia-lyase
MARIGSLPSRLTLICYVVPKAISAMDGVIVHNDMAGRSQAAELPAHEVLDPKGFAVAWDEITQWPEYQATPLHSLSGLANSVGIENIWFKDESKRFRLKSFKALGGAFAVVRLAIKEVARATGLAPISKDVFAGLYHDCLAHMTVTTATDGNHGRAVAWAAAQVGCRCVIFVHEAVSDARVLAIETQGAQVRRVPGNYDDAVRRAADEAQLNHWHLVSDTSYAGFVDVPRDVMQGYRVMVEEAVRAIPIGQVPTHAFVQVGVGALAGAVCAHLWATYGSNRPLFITVEAKQAACLQRSVMSRRPVAIEGNLDTLMAGLACGEVSLLAWQILAQGVDFAMTIDDEQAVSSMRVLADGQHGDPRITSGESGAAGLAGLLTALSRPDIARLINLGPESRILLFGTEGDTDPDLYQRLIRKDATTSS